MQAKKICKEKIDYHGLSIWKERCLVSHVLASASPILCSAISADFVGFCFIKRLNLDSEHAVKNFL